MMPGLRHPEMQDHAGTKRSLSDDDDVKPAAAAAPKRRRIVRHAIRHKQPWTVDPAVTSPQDEAFFQSQVLRAISISLTAVGFEGAKPTALEAFRAQVDEFMRHFLTDVRTSMHLARRTAPTAPDFARALAHTGYTSSSLEPQLALPLPPSLALPAIAPPPPPDDAPPRLEAVLGPELSGAPAKNARPYIPAHFPSFPSKHTWQSTPVFSERETDPRKIRERATQEGVLAEQALRKLMAANRTAGSAKRGSGNDGVQGGKRRQIAAPQSRQMWEEAMREVMREDEAKRGDVWMGGLEGEGGKEDVVVDSGLLVNYDKKYWRKGAQSGAW